MSLLVYDQLIFIYFIRDLGFHFFLPSHDRRPLHPTRKERKKISGPLSGNSQVQLIITIMHAFNVPVRIENGSQTSEESENRRDKLNSELGGNSIC